MGGLVTIILPTLVRSIRYDTVWDTTMFYSSEDEGLPLRLAVVVNTTPGLHPSQRSPIAGPL